MIGMLIELFGIVNLFGNFFPIVLSIMKQLPIIGTILNTPVVIRLTDRMMGVLPGAPRDWYQYSSINHMLHNKSMK